MPKVLDVSRNRITGTLPQIATVPENATAFNCSLNRVSGSVPSWLQKYAISDSIQVLEGNLVGCKSNDPTLKNDPDQSSYVCGSDDLERALYVWVTVFGLILLTGSCIWHCYWRSLSAPRSQVSEHATVQTDSPQQPPEHPQSTQQATSGHFYRFVKFVSEGLNPLSSVLASTDGTAVVDYFMRQTLLCCTIATAFFMVVVMPVLVVMNNSTHSIFSVKYAWVISSAFLVGSTAGIAVLILWTTITVTTVGFMGMQFTKFVTPPSFLLRTQSNDWILSVVLIVMIVLVDAATMIGINYSYIRIYANTSYHVSQEQKLFAQFALGTVKATWNVLIIMIINRLSGLNSSVLSDAKRCVLLGTALLLFNNIITPCMVSATTDSQCFLYVFKSPSDITAEYTLPNQIYYVTTPTGAVGVSPGGRLLSTTFTPPFVYSHQCGSSLIRNYVPVYFYSVLVSGIVRPLVLLLSSRCRQSNLPWIVSYGMRQALPHILWPWESSAINQKLLPAISIVISFSNYIAVLLIFGFTCPPLAACVTLAVFAETVTWRALIQRYATIVPELDALDEACAGVGRAFGGVTYLILVTWACVSTLLIVDIVAAESGWVGAVWVPAIVASVTVLVIIIPRCYARAQRNLDYDEEAQPQLQEDENTKHDEDEDEDADRPQRRSAVRGPMTDEMMLKAIHEMERELRANRHIMRRQIEELIRRGSSTKFGDDEAKENETKREIEISAAAAAAAARTSAHSSVTPRHMPEMKEVNVPVPVLVLPNAEPQLAPSNAEEEDEDAPVAAPAPAPAPTGQGSCRRY